MAGAERRASKAWQQKVSLAVGVGAALLSGTAYGFGAYETDLKERLGLTQGHLETVGVSLHVGMYLFKPLSGIIMDRYGARPAFVSAAIVVGCAYSTIGLITLAPPSSHVLTRTLAIALFVLVGAGSGLGYLAALKTNARNFPAHSRGKIMGVMASAFGLSAVSVSIAFSATHSAGLPLWCFFVLMGALTASAYSAAAVYVRPTDSIPEKAIELGNTEEEESRNQDHQLLTTGSGDVDWSHTHSFPVILTALLQSYRFWSLYLLFAVITGCGLFVMNNVGTLVQSLNGQSDADLTQLLVVLIAVFGCIGRLLVGFFSDKANVPRAVFLTGCFVVMGVFLVATAFLTTPKLLILSVLGVGASYGGSWVITSTIASEVWGLPNFGKVYGMFATAPAFSSMLFNKIEGEIYDARADPETHICYGTRCYQAAFVLTGSLALVCGLISVPATWSKARDTHNRSTVDFNR